MTISQALLTTLSAATLLTLVPKSRGLVCDELPPPEEMVTKKLVPVYRAPNRNTAVIAKIYPKTQISARQTRKTLDCKEGWYQREDRGYVCGKQLRPLEEEETNLSREDHPDIRKGMDAVIVIERKTKVYQKSKRTGELRRDTNLLKGSILSGTANVVVDGISYFESRSGYFVPMENVKALPPPIDTLSIPISPGGDAPAAIAVGEALQVVDAPSEAAPQIETLERWQPIRASSPLQQIGDFVRLPEGGYVKADQLSWIRPAPRPKRLAENEKWLAVDIEEQLLQVFEGDRLIRIIPCSTGIKGNTHKGRYAIQKKLRQQTMRLRMGRQRVEDVQWVMYYDRDKSIAIHSAYWHREFGTPKSHGCVNLPTEDARWVYEWSEPKVCKSDSITLPLPRGSGTRVVVF
jgi:lipoprotein-anchoring transpeptidase ErfK/SrfK